MLASLQWFVALVALIAIGWGVVKFCDLLGETLDSKSRRRFSRLVRVGVVIVGIIFSVVIAVMVGAAMFFGTGCEMTLDPMSCS